MGQLDRFALLRDDILNGNLTRRDVLKRATALGASAPVIAGLLAACGGGDDDDEEAAAPTATTETGQAEDATPEADAAEASPTEEMSDAAETEEEPAGTTPAAETGETEEAEPTEAGETGGRGRGAGDLLRILNWQAPTNLNPHFSQGYHNSAPAMMVLEPLLTIDDNGDLHAVLAEEVPSLENGGVAEDGTSVSYTLKEGLIWSDGEPLTTEDVEFTWQWVTDEATGATSISAFNTIESIDIEDERSFTVNFSEPNPTWYNAFSRGGGLGGQILPKHLLEDYTGAEAANAPFNLEPIGTGPYKITEFRPGDVVVYEINENYREPDKPYFSEVEFKGGGDAPSAARAVFQTGETDYAPNLQVETEILESMLEEGLGELIINYNGNVEQILINFADPNTEVDGAFSEPSTQHPFLSELDVREALAMGCDRETIATQLYGPTGRATANVVTAPPPFVSPNTSFTFDTEAAAQLLDEAGWATDGDVRSKDGVEMRVLYQTTVNTLRQKTQEIVKQAWETMGVPTELKTIDAAVFFSSDAGNPDTWSHFYADVEMATVTTDPYPARHMQRWTSIDPDEDLAQQSNNWSGRNLNRWRNEEYNELWQQAITELDPEVQAELFIAMNDIVVNDVVTIPLVDRAGVDGKSNEIQGVVPSPWEQFTYDIANWYRE